MPVQNLANFFLSIRIEPHAIVFIAESFIFVSSRFVNISFQRNPFRTRVRKKAPIKKTGAYFIVTAVIPQFHQELFVLLLFQ